MLKVEKNENEKRKYSIYNTKLNSDEKTLITDLDLIFSPITNKFHKLIEFLEDSSIKLGQEYDEWFIKLVNDYKNSDCDSIVIKQNISQLKTWCDKYLDILDINFDNYINRSKISKNSIFFDAEEIKRIIKTSNYLKIYFILAQDIDMKLINKAHKEIYNELIDDINNNNIIYKLFKIVSSKTFEYNFSDKHMWEFIKTIYCKTTDMHIFSIFNFLMNNILVTCSPESNPIPYLIAVIDESIKWILKNNYKEAIIYSEGASHSQDIYTIAGKDNLESYSYNDTLGKLLIISYNQLEKLGIDDLDSFKTTMDNLKEISLFANYITYPLLSKILDIPYRHFMTLTATNSYLLNILMYQLLSDDFKKEYSVLTKMLLYYNTQKPILKTTYKVKNIDVFTKTIDTFLGFKNIHTPYDIYSNILGRISRNSYQSFVNNENIINFSLIKLESDIIRFYNKFFGNQLENLYDELRNKIDRLL